MHIVNIMFSRGGGGIEQAFIDYCEGLRDRGHRVTALIYPGAFVEAPLKKLGIELVAMRNFGEWDLLAVYRLRRHLESLNPDIIVAHANRAYSLSNRAASGKYPVVAVAQNYSTKRFTNADAVFATTHDLIVHLMNQGIPESHIFHIPNMVRCHELPHRGLRNEPPLIGALGRFVHKKGFHVFIEALKILAQRGQRFRVVLGGDGDEGAALKEQARVSGLGGIIEFPGWIHDKKAFYSNADIFCLPSLHEPFGIVLLEAFSYGTPVVSTDSEGPHDIITPNYDAVIVEKDNALALADGLAKLLEDSRFADDIAANAFAKAKTRYSIESVCERIDHALANIVEYWRAEHGRRLAA